MRNLEISCGNNDALSVYKYIKNIQPSNKYNWDRPESWLEFPAVVDTDQVFYALYPVTDTDYNTATITAQGNYIVDWGDGSVENFSSGATASHNYTYSNIPSSTTTPFGYRQAIIKLTPQAGNDLTVIGAIQYSNFLDIVASGPNLVCGSINLNPNLESLKLLCKITGVISTNALKYIELDYNVFSLRSDLSNVFSGNYSLQYVSPFNTFSVTDFSFLFFGCFSLIAFPDINISNATNINSICGNCTSMVYFPTTSFINPISTSSAFNTCTSLRSININATIFGGTLMTMFSNIVNLLEFPALNIEQNTSTYTFGRQIRKIKAYNSKCSIAFTAGSVIGRAQLVEFFTNLGTANAGATINITNCFGTPSLSAEDRLIATNKGFTLIG